MKVFPMGRRRHQRVKNITRHIVIFIYGATFEFDNQNTAIITNAV